MQFRNLSFYLEKLEKTSSRNEITQILSELFKKTSPDEIDKVCYLLSGRLVPNWAGINFNIAEKLMFKIIARAFAKEPSRVRDLFKEKGDLGEVAAELSSARSRSKISVTEVYDKMVEVAKEEGEGSVARKISKMAGLLTKVDSLSARYIARIPVNNLRLGFSDMTILDALSFLVKGDKSARKEIEEAYNVTVDIGKIANLIRQKGLSGVEHVVPIPGTPIRPSLAERLPSAEKILEKVGPKVIIERKYDGFRAQVHLFKENSQRKVRIFSRNLENTTHMFPDLVDAIKKINVESAIFDCEAIAYDSKRDKFRSFQETVQRKRKHGIEEAIKRLPLKLFIFDILYKDGKSYLNLSFGERRKILESIKFSDKNLEIARQTVTDSAEKIRDLIKEYLSEGLEGALIKKIDASYKAGARGYHWVKYKKTTEEGVADTIDCLVMGVNKGKGKRTGFGIGAFLVGVYDPSTEFTSSKVEGLRASKFKTVSKIGTGLSDEQWRELDKRSKKLEVRDKPKEYEVNKNLTPDTWTKPSLVVEILADEITKSPIHSAGLALRFPRLIKFRDDKDPKDSTTLKELSKLYKMQKA